MKKLIIMAGIAAAFSFTACNGGADNKASGMDSLFSQAQTDSLATSVAQFMGMQDNMQLTQIMAQDPTISKEMFLKGVKYAFAADTTVSFGYGMQEGMRLLQQIKQWESMGLKIDRNAFIANFGKYVTADSVNDMEAMQVRDIATGLDRQCREAYQLYQRALLEEAPEAKANVERGRQYIDSVAKADNAVKVLASGVAYKVTQAGEGKNLTDNSRATIKYTATTADGRVFDKGGDEEVVRPTLVGNRVPGLREAMHNLSKGSKATIYIPGKEAYGVEQNGRFNLGPNELVIYEVEIVDVLDEPDAAAKLI